jgi:outer membrane protein assembly factor BamB
VFDAEGTLLWYRALARDYPDVSNQVGMASSPVLWKGLIILALETDSDSFVLAIDGTTGQNRWKTPRAKGINWATPLVVPGEKGAELLLQSRSGLTAYDPQTGEARWVHADGLDPIASPIAGGELLLLPGGGVLALRPGSQGARPEVAWKSSKLRASTASPLFYEGRVYAVSSAGVLTCADAADGSILWQERMAGPFSASPAAGDGKIYCVNEEGQTTVIRTRSEDRVASTNPLGEPVLASPAISGGAIFLRSDKHLYSVGM